MNDLNSQKEAFFLIIGQLFILREIHINLKVFNSHVHTNLIYLQELIILLIIIIAFIIQSKIIKLEKLFF